MEIQNIQKYFNIFNSDLNSYHLLMRRRVNTILLISNLFDAYIFEKEGLVFEKIYNEYEQLNLSQIPQVMVATTPEEVRSILDTRTVDLVITFLKIDVISVEELKTEYPEVPLVLLLNRMAEIMAVKKEPNLMEHYTHVYAWKRNPRLLLAMIKLREDRLNLKPDTAKRKIRVILFVEEDFVFASYLIPFLFSEVLSQTQRIISSERNQQNKRARMRQRPKIIFAKNWQEAQNIYTDTKQYLLAVISSSNFINNRNSDIAQSIINELKEDDHNFPFLFFTNNRKEKIELQKLGLCSHLKKELRPKQTISDFLRNEVGFGNYRFQNQDGSFYTEVDTIKKLEKLIEELPEEIFTFSANKNQFSRWLIAHGEFDLSEEMKKLSLNDFPNICEAKRYVIDTFHFVRMKKHRGRIVDFAEEYLNEKNQVILIRKGSLGGKGRGIAFMNAILVALATDEKYPQIDVGVPRTAIIGTEEFDEFIEKNHILEKVNGKTDDEIDEIFLHGNVSYKLIHNLRLYLKALHKPIAVRSSGLLEDSQAQPFAGVYRTFMLPNNSLNFEFRLQEVLRAIKLIFASVFLKNAVDYRKGLGATSEEEKMAVIIQEVVGQKFGENIYTPLFSGVGQSYNYYPKKPITNKDCLVSLGVGLGNVVVDGEMNYQYSPNYPKVNYLQPTEIVENYQRCYFYVDLKPENENPLDKNNTCLVKKRLTRKELKNQFKMLTSVWDYQNKRFIDATYAEGPRVLTYRMLTYFNKFGFSDLLKEILEFSELTTGYPAEIEFAVKQAGNKEQPDRLSFNMLQVRPLNVSMENISIDKKSIVKEQQVIMSSNVIGNGTFSNLYDIVFIAPETYNNLETQAMAEELAEINAKFSEDNKYVLIGTGRWGSSDRFLGIPVKWSQINHAQLIVEYSLKSHPVDASFGSHFLHNLIAANVGYLSILTHSEFSHIDWEWLKKQKTVFQGKYFHHIQTDDEMMLSIDSKNNIGILSKTKKPEKGKKTEVEK